MSLVKKADRLPFILDDLLGADWFGGISNQNRIAINTPAVNVKETNSDFTLELAVPGLSKEDFNIQLDNDVLTVSSELKTENEIKSEDEKYTKREFNYRVFKRSFSLPDTVDSNDISASYENGVLLVKLPKREEAKVQPKRAIEIS